MKQTGYKMKEYGIPTKRYCQTLDLKVIGIGGQNSDANRSILEIGTSVF